MLKMSDEAFRQLGSDTMVYVRPIDAETTPELKDTDIDFDGQLFGIFQANGLILAVLTDYDTAVLSAAQHGFTPVLVH